MKAIEELEKELTEMVNNFVEHDYRKEALKELDEIEKLGKICPNCAFIVESYPNFNSIVFKLEKPNHLILTIAINYKDLVGQPQAIHNAALMIHSWFDMGAEEK